MLLPLLLVSEVIQGVSLYGKETLLLELLDVNCNLLTKKKYTWPRPAAKKMCRWFFVSVTKCPSITCPSNDTVMQQRLKVLVAGGGGGLFVAARERRVDVDAGQRGHRLFAVRVGLVAEGQLGGRGGAGGFLGDEERNEEGDDHGTRPQQEGRAGDEGSLRERERENPLSPGAQLKHIQHCCDVLI